MLSALKSTPVRKTASPAFVALGLSLCGLLVGWTLGSPAAAQTIDTPAPPWQAMRVYVPENQVDSVVPRDYLTIDIEDLERLLAEESRRRAQSTLQATGIQRAVYVARWTDQMLSSPASQWKVALPDNAQPLNISRTSIALSEPMLAPAGSQSLMRHLKYVDDARLQLVASGLGASSPANSNSSASSTSDAGANRNSGGGPNAGAVLEQTLWFGFKAKTRYGENGQQTVDLVLPRAALATMLISVPANATVKATLPCARTENPAQFLPPEWPEETLVSGADEHWYVVHLSGRENCSLKLTPAAKANQFPYRTSVTSAQCDTIVQPSGLQTIGRFQLAKVPSTGTARLRVEEPLHVRSIQVNGVETTQWRTAAESGLDSKPAANANEPAATPRARIVEVTLDEVAEGPLLLTVEAISRLTLPFDGVLPRVEVADAFVMDGRGTFASAESVQIDDVQCQAHQLSTSSAAGYPSWQWQWTGRPPAVRARVRSGTDQWTVRSLTRFNVQTDVIVATAYVHLGSADVQGNQAVFRLANGWFVDSFELENPPPGVSASIRESQQRGSELCVRWEEPRTDLDVHLAINAHFPQRTEVDTLRLQSTRIATLPGADQVDTYVVEPSGRFQVEVDPELLRLRIGDEELLAWQRELLPRLADVWIFRGTRGNTLPIRLRRVRSTFDAKLRTVVTRTDKETIVSYRVICEPISGSIDQLRLLLPIPAQKLAPTWSLAASLDGSYPPGLLVNSRATSSSAGETTFIIELSQDMAEPFQLESELRLAAKDGLDAIPLPSLPQAVTQDAIVAVPGQFALPEGIVGLEVLPEGLCCAEGNLVQSQTVAGGQATAARYDPDIVSHLQMLPATGTSRGGWVREAAYEHWQHSGGRARHRSAWEFVLPAPRGQEFVLPEGWDFERLSIDGQSVDAVEQAGRRLRVELPEGESVRVEMICSSRTSSNWWGNRWWGRSDFGEPASGMPELKKRRVVWFPGTIIAGSGWPKVAPATLADRLLPRAWWRWLGIDPWQNLVAAPQVGRTSSPVLDTHPVLALLADAPPLGGNWWPLELDQQPGRDQIWHVERSLASAIVLALTLLAGAAVLSLCGGRLKRWWLLGTATAIGLCLVPGIWLIPVQLLALAIVTAALVRSSLAVMLRSRPVARAKEMVPPSSLISASRSVSLVLLACGLASGLTGQPLMAQPLDPSQARDRAEIYGILIPVDSDFQIAGDYVYVPTRLSRLLSNSKESDAKSANVAVQAAYYTLRISNDPVTLVSSVGEITVELTVQATRADAELRLPFAAREIQLQRAFLDSQEVFQGLRLRHDDMLSWRATDADRHTLRLVFRPRAIVEKDGRGMLSVGIPAIPMAKLEVMGDDLRDVTVDAIGGAQLESPRFLTAELGPANRLMLSWPLAVNRSAVVQVQSDTWVHTRGDQLMAQCQLRVRGATALPSVLHIVGDNNWQPVGQEWEDCRLISADGASAAGRPVYSVQRAGESISDSLTIRVLLLARSEATQQGLPIPFLSLQEAALQQRTLAISHADSTAWKTTGTETWQPLLTSQAATLWDKARLSEQPTLLRVPTGTVLATLQRTMPPPSPLVDETTEISLQNPEVKIRYAARWLQPVSGEAAVRFQVPNGLRVDGAFVDALPARHTLHPIAARPNAGGAGGAGNGGLGGASAGNGSVGGASELVVFIDATRGSMQSVHLLLSSPTRLNRPMRLPRPLLSGFKVASSLVQIFRGAELTSQVSIAQGAEIQLEKAEVRPSPLLLNLHTLVGQVELGDRFREAAELPIEVRLSRPTGNRTGQAVMQLVRSEQGWSAQLNASVDVQGGEVSQIFFDLPSSLAASFREPIDVTVPTMLWPSADSSRAILCALPQLGSDGKAQLSISVRLPSAGASQSVTVPDIRMLGLSAQRPVLALPKVIAGEEVRWTQVGRPLPENWLESRGLDYLDLEGYALYEPSVNQFQAMWHTRQAEDQTAEVLLTRMRLDDQSDSHVSGEIDYWIDPHDQAYLSVALPERCQLVGAQLGTRPVNWLTDDERQIRILLQPSYLPIQLRLFVHWAGAGGRSRPAGRFDLQLPELDARSSGNVLVGLQGERDAQDALALDASHTASELSSDEADQLLGSAWVDTLVHAAPTAADHTAEERASWLPHWNPDVLDIREADLTVPKQFLPRDAAANNPANGQPGTVATSLFWQQYARLLEIDLDELPEPSPEDVGESQASLRWFRLDPLAVGGQLSIHTGRPSLARAMMAQLVAAASLLALSLILWSFRSAWLKNRLIGLAELVWPLWLGLAAVTCLVLPVIWPGLIIGLCALIVLWRRHRELKQDRRFVLSPRALR